MQFILKMREIKIFRYCLVIVGLGWQALNSACYAENLDQLLSAARKNDSQYRAVKSSYKAALTLIDQAEAAFFPTFSVSANANLNKQKIEYEGGNTSDRKLEYDSYGYTLQLKQPVFRYLYIAQLDQAHAQVAQALAKMEESEFELVVRVSEAFFEALQAKAGLKEASDEYELADKQQQEIKLSYTQGAATIADKLEADSRVALSKAKLLELSNELNNKLYILRQITKLDLAQEHLNQDITLPPELKESLEYWLHLAETRNPSVLFQMAVRGVAKSEIDKANSGHYPELDIVANYGTNKQGPSAALSSSTLVTSGTIGMQLTVPIYSGGLVAAKAEEAVRMLEKADEELDAARVEARNLAFQAYNGIKSNQAQWQAYDQAVDAYTQSLKAVSQGLKEGTKTPSDVFESRQKLSKAESDRVRAIANLLLNHIKLRLAVGDLVFVKSL